jgi:hypothetical protein
MNINTLAFAHEAVQVDPVTEPQRVTGSPRITASALAKPHSVRSLAKASSALDLARMLVSPIDETARIARIEMQTNISIKENP